MNNFDKGFDAGRDAVRKRRKALLLVVCAFMAAVATLQEYSAHHYLLAALAVVFFLVIMPWLGWAWMNPEERRRLCRLLGGQDGLLVNAIIPAVVVQFGLRIRPVKREIHRYA